ncbi:hypothetical protein COCMIDRAFT_105363 [Bipolaris oryzae ATCC 44560]|uniref:Uncharacterized protein n=1 Tax=Bipolaris oryzae ATCC 44560 TaxID=930090 RepID=W6YW36_COCMI|nr:uncharacterized protein COCMIDRAFT_105363 [Bipolaris oryzae ATCC 44560]EUC41753.1 hypothetical protein COCMIDRAFT_105363 [Bipolaris oryzae ATCC 44560]
MYHRPKKAYRPSSYENAHTSDGKRRHSDQATYCCCSPPAQARLMRFSIPVDFSVVGLPKQKH